MSATTPVLNIDAALRRRISKDGTRIKDRINRIGIELEGGWTKLPEGTALAHDGSVRVGTGDPVLEAEINTLTTNYNNGLLTRTRYEAAIRPLVARRDAAASKLLTGELPSEPLEPSKFVAWMKKFYPSHVNETCGLHVHMSFESALHYQRLMTPAYQGTVVRYLTDWAKEEGLPSSHPIWSRLKGESRYCQLKYFADAQAQTRSKSYDQSRPGHRYTAINYPFLQHGTVEVRILPMMENVDQGIRSVQRVLDITNAFLVTAAKKEDKAATAIVGDPTDRFVHERRLSV